MIRWLFGSRRRAESAPDASPRATPAPDASGAASLGLREHQAGRLAEAEAHYRAALAKDPDHVDAWHFLGVIALQRGDPAQAVHLISNALSRNASNAAAYNNLGNALAALGKRLESLSAYLEAIALEPESADALCNLGNAFRSLGKLEKAIGCYQRALAITPDLQPAQAGLKSALEEAAPRGAAPAQGVDPSEADIRRGLLLQEQGRIDEAIECYRAILGLRAEVPEAHFNLGNAYKDQGRLDEAIASFQQALALAPDFAAAHANLGSAFLQQGRQREALICFGKAIALEPELAEAHFNLGIASYHVGDLRTAKAALTRYLRFRPQDRAALLTLGESYARSNELDEAAGCLERVLADSPNDAAAHNLLGNLRRNQARHAEAMRHYEIAILHDDHPVVVYQNLLFCMMCAGTYSAADIHARHVEFARRFEQPLLSLQPPAATVPDPERRLRIGYVSPEFRSNVVGHYVQPILENHDRAAFEVHCYFTGSNRDVVTGRLSLLVDEWHDVGALSDDEIASLVRAHKIDVLIDLCGHGPGNRILVFARKPAPVQVSYLDYSATTGLSSIDHRLTTAYCDPVGTSERYYSEKLFRLADAYWTYNPALRAPISALPMQSNGHVTFGSFNLYYRITTEVVDLWARLLAAIAGSRLVIVGVATGSTEAALVERFGRAGVARDRMSIYGLLSYERYNELMGSVDVALAPFPYNGATTVMDCLWNGLPVVAQEGGETFSSRLGCAVLAELGLTELIARNDDEYVRIASELASAMPRLIGLRGSLRQRLEGSSLRDFPRFTRGLELAYRSMWKDWCAMSTGIARN
jgi:predicted O-linked N-acetylglucosamine transferase (SPINDLY family)